MSNNKKKGQGRGVDRKLGYSLFVCLLFFVSVAISTNCRTDCKNGGTCDTKTGTCDCQTGFGGEDCSLRMQSISDGETTDDEVGNREWSYYTTEITDDHVISLTYSVQQHNDGDCDLYIRENNLPTRIIYDTHDSSYDQNFALAISATPGNTYYAGVYGYRDCIYSISLSLTRSDECENGCSHHGTCINGVCECDLYHTGSDCSIEIKELSMTNEEEEGELEYHEWEYYMVRPEMDVSGKYMAFEVGIIPYDLSSNNYIYIRENQLPTLYDFTYRNGILLGNAVITLLESPQSSLYYIGIYTANPSLQYSIYYSSIDRGDQECLSCSLHGQCINHITCHCDENYSGDFCESYDNEMEVGRAYEGIVVGNMWNYYHFASFSQSNLLISLMSIENEDSFDCQIFIKANQTPTRNDFDYSSITLNSTQITIINPLGNTWYVAITSYYSCYYAISQSIQPSGCPGNCNGRGTCNEGRCECEIGWTGESCLYPIVTVSNPSVSEGLIGMNSWYYYKISVPSGFTSISVSMLEVSSVGYISLFLQRASLPSLNAYYDCDTNLSSNIHNVYYVVSDNGSRDFYVGIHGTSSIPLNSNYSFKLGIYCPDISFDN